MRSILQIRTRDLQTDIDGGRQENDVRFFVSGDRWLHGRDRRRLYNNPRLKALIPCDLILFID